MKRIKCIVIDDEQSAIEMMRRLIQKIPELLLVHCTTDPVKGLAYAKDPEVKLVFADLQMPQMHGLELIRELGDLVQVVCCSGYINYGPQLSLLDVSGYLQKPVCPQAFQKVVDRVISKLSYGQWASKQYAENKYDPEEPVAFQTDGREMIIIRMCDIEYIEAQARNAAIYHTDGKVQVLHSLKEIEAILPPKYFMRVNKSFLVAADKIATYNKREKMLKLTKSSKSAKIKVGDYYREIVRSFFAEKFNHLSNESKRLF